MKKFAILTIAVFAISALIFSGIAHAGCGACRAGAAHKHHQGESEAGDIANQDNAGTCGEACKDTPCAKCKAKQKDKCVVECPECGAKFDAKEQFKKQCGIN